MMGKYYIKFGLTKYFNASSKAMKDVMNLLKSRGYKEVASLPVDTNKYLKLLDVPLLLFTLLFRVGKKGCIVYVVPSNAKRIRFLKFFRKVIGYRLICFVNDVQSLRMKSASSYMEQEMESIAAADVVMAPNENSVEILREEHQMNNPMVSIGVWDYVSESTSFYEGMIEDIRTVAFAGNLKKSPFIDELNKIGLNFKIWGNGREKGKIANCEYMGAEPPERIACHVAECAWGLVWDGASIGTCDELLGTYLRFNNPHKCGLYLSAGVPLIVWKESGMARLVSKYHVGISVSSLNEAAAIIGNMDMQMYAYYRKNAKQIGMQVRKGEFFLRALTEVENLIIS